MTTKVLTIKMAQELARAALMPLWIKGNVTIIKNGIVVMIQGTSFDDYLPLHQHQTRLKAGELDDYQRQGLYHVLEMIKTLNPQIIIMTKWPSGTTKEILQVI